MAQRGDKRLVHVDELGKRRDGPPADQHGAVVILVEQIRYRIDNLEAGQVRIEWRQLAVTVQPLQGRPWFPNVTVSRTAQAPDECQARVDAQRAVEIMKRRIEFLFDESAVMRIKSERLGIVRIQVRRPQREISCLDKFLL